MAVSSKNIKEFKKLYEAAIKNEAADFVFEGQEIFIGYAKYVIEYQETLK